MSTYNLHIKNYQIIRNAHLSFPKGITLITGPSNNGKSSLFKAFKQLVYNQSGTDFIKHGTTKSEITLELLDDNQSPVYTIDYSKSKSGGSYLITTPNDKQYFQKLGSNQLDAVKEITHIDKQLDYNFWNQMDKPFLISLPNREQFDYLQQSPHTETLNNCLQSMVNDRKQFNQDLLKAQSKLELLQSQFTTIKQQKSALEGIIPVYQKLQNIENQFTQIKHLKDLLIKYDSLSTDLKPLQDTIQRLQNIPVVDLEQLTSKIQQIKSKFTQLQQTVKPINELQNTIQQTQTQFDRISLFKQQYFKVCPVCNRPFENHNI